MRYISTRGGQAIESFRQVVATGLAPDGGLYLPEKLPVLTPLLKEWAGLSYPELAFQFLRLFANDIEGPVLKRMVEKAYSGFEHSEIAPLKKLDNQLYVLELFHGPTLAFKDFALQVLGELYAEQIKKSGKGIHVLGATSGDTGAAAIHGLLGKPGIHIFILYPEGRISPLQELQMTATGADNVFPIAIQGTFDDAQRIVKETFGDLQFREKYHLSAVNSINLARILAQCVYYLYAWFRIPQEQRANVELVVPTGNFGNVLAGWLVKQMGVPIQKFRVATNQNDILHRFFQTGEYSIHEVQPSLAPSMDIQVASNFERFLFYLLDQDPQRVLDTMKTFQKSGKVQLPLLKEWGFHSSRTSDKEIIEIIRRVDAQYHYEIDPHTACGFKDISPDHTTIVLSTASPAKFPEVMKEALGREVIHPRLELLKTLPENKNRCTLSVAAIQQFIQEHALSE